MNSASSASFGWRLSSSKRRHASRTSSAARSRAAHPLEDAVLAQRRQMIEVDDDAFGADRDGDEIPVPRRELVQRLEHALAHARRTPPARSRCSFSRSGSSSHSDASSAFARASPRGSVGEPHDRRRSRRGLEGGIGVDRARDAEDLLAPLSGILVEQPLGTIETPAGNPRDGGHALGRQPRRLRLDDGMHRLLREAAERHELAARANRLRQRAELVGEQDDDRVRRRLLEILQQRVGRLVVQRVRGDEEVHAAVGLERPHVEVAPEPSHFVDANLVAERLEEVEVGMGAALHPAAIAEQVGGERERGLLLADARRAVEEVRVHGPVVERGRQQALRHVLLDDLLKHLELLPDDGRRARPGRATRRAGAPARESALASCR